MADDAFWVERMFDVFVGFAGGCQLGGYVPARRFTRRPKTFRVARIKALGVEAQETHRSLTIVDDGEKKLLPALGVGHSGDGIAGAKSMAPTGFDDPCSPDPTPRHSDTPGNGELLHNTKHLGRVKSMRLDAPAVLWETRGGVERVAVRVPELHGNRFAVLEVTFVLFLPIRAL